MSEQHGSKAQRIAELERQIAYHIEQLETREFGKELHRESLVSLKAELSRLRNEGGDSKTEDHKAIWLSPNCGGGECSDERVWREDSHGVCDECGLPETKYIRADLATPSPLASVEAGRGDLVPSLASALARSARILERIRDAYRDERSLSAALQASFADDIACIREASELVGKSESEAGRGEREALERDLAQMDAKIEHDVAAGHVPPEAAQNVRAVIALACDGLAYRALSQGNGGHALKPGWLKRDGERAAARVAEWSKGNGGEAVGWRTDGAPVGVPVEIRMPVSYGWWKATAKRHHYPDEEEARFPNEFWEILHYNGEALLKVFYGGPKLEWRDLAAPSSPPEGVREALEKAAEICEDYARRFSISRPYNDGGVEQSYREAAEQIRNLTTTPSRGLVEAAEWQLIETAPKDGDAVLIYKPNGRRSGDYTIAAYWGSIVDGQGEGWIACAGVYFLDPPTHWMPLPAPPRTLSAKPTATADGGRDG